MALKQLSRIVLSQSPWVRNLLGGCHCLQVSPRLTPRISQGCGSRDGSALGASVSSPLNRSWVGFIQPPFHRLPMEASAPFRLPARDFSLLLAVWVSMVPLETQQLASSRAGRAGDQRVSEVGARSTPLPLS